MKGRGKYQVRPQRVCNTDRLPKQDPRRSEQLFYFRNDGVVPISTTPKGLCALSEVAFMSPYELIGFQ